MKNRTLHTVVALALLAAASLPSLAQDPTPLLTRSQDQLIAVLKSDASQKDKSDACRELAVIGTQAAVPALAALLPDPQYHHMARYALETMPDAAAGEALRAALGTLKGRPLVGVIGSLGVRRDTQATAALTKLLQADDDLVAQAAARALGQLGSTEAAQALQAALPKAKPENQLALCEGLFRSAEALAGAAQRPAAIAIYDQLRSNAALPHQVRAGATRGAILARTAKNRLNLLGQSIRSDDYILTAAAAQAALQLPGRNVTKLLAAELVLANADKQILLLDTLGQRGDPAALPALTAAAQTGAKPVRLAAVRALPQLRDAAAAPALLELLGDADRDISRAAQEGFASLAGPDVDASVLRLLNSDRSGQQLTAIDLIGRRRMTDALPGLLAAASGPNAQVRVASLRRLGELGSPADLSALLDLLLKANTDADVEAAEQAVGAVCAKAPEPEACVAQVTSRLAQAAPSQKGALLRVLAAVGGPASLKAVRAAVSDTNVEVRGAAIRALGAWKTADAAPDLLQLAQTTSDPTDQMLCRRSYLRLAANTDLPVDQRLTMCRQVAGLLQQGDEKKLLLAALGSIQSPEALPLITPYLEDAATKDEASAAVVGVADGLLRGQRGAQYASRLLEPLQKAAQATGNTDLAGRAKALLEQATNRARAR
ncbi:MAG: hypothetical protein FJ387_12240 [Verrucomicrobia bacterium]|nr:hypothetical protein [Verrucomicrobiota bacterium]